jgi:hypothetical protein
MAYRPVKKPSLSASPGSRGQRVLGRQDQAGRAENGVHSRGENADRLARFGQPEIHFRAFGPPDPIPLHHQHALRPAALQLADIVQ